MKVYNTASRMIEEVTQEGSTLGIYACGPTVYDFAHIGHMRKYTMDAVLVAALRHAGFPVLHVQNITDVGHLVSDADDGEDKMEKGAKKYGKTVWEVAAEFETYFWKAIDMMQIPRPDISCKATDHISDQIELIQKLEANGLTYVIADGVYFDTSKFPSYGDLARLDPDSLKAGARVEMVAGKRNTTDFALWKFSPKDQQRAMEWESPWAPPGEGPTKGFPGWHIECSAMAMRYLGDQFAIHTGGIDHIPIHHTNEIAQAEGATGKHPFVKIWVHHNFLRVEGEKMSKSLGNFTTLEDCIARGYSPFALKLLFFGSHYRSELNFTWDALSATQTAYDRLIGILSTLSKDNERLELSEEKLEKIETYRSRFFNEIENDLRTPEALAVLWEVLKSNIPSRDKYELILEFDTVLGLGLQSASQQVGNNSAIPIPSTIASLVEQRALARQKRDFQAADTLRAKIRELGFVIHDAPSGQEVYPAQSAPDL